MIPRGASRASTATVAGAGVNCRSRAGASPAAAPARMGLGRPHGRSKRTFDKVMSGARARKRRSVYAKHQKR